MKVYRDWRISGDTEWLRKAVAEGQGELELLYRETWDPARKELSRSRTTTLMT